MFLEAPVPELVKDQGQTPGRIQNVDPFLGGSCMVPFSS